MAQRRPITTHPAFPPFLAVWFAALFGLGLAVLPAPLLERAFGAVGLGAFLPLTETGRLIASGAAALLGAVLGLVLALPLARRGRRDPRPIYADPEAAIENAIIDQPVRRPLRVLEELAGGTREAANDEEAAEPEMRTAESDEGFMILTPQSIHPPRPAPDLDALLVQFDTALAAFRSDEDGRPARRAGDPDPVHAFVARQTGAPVSSQLASPLGGRIPDHQAELRAALDKLARVHRKD